MHGVAIICATISLAYGTSARNDRIRLCPHFGGLPDRRRAHRIRSHPGRDRPRHHVVPNTDVRSGTERSDAIASHPTARNDTFARSRKQLLPLWADLTAACPEIVYSDVSPTGLGSRFLLHRTVIEIRDCLRILSRYAPPEQGAMTSSETPDTVRLRYAGSHTRVRQGSVAPPRATMFSPCPRRRLMWMRKSPN
ncbi:DUF6545 domain-containing protein [Nocardia sp. NPDC052278]|uniref:DUF6545 domain-containing protein n=1 Tax=unclassified Nocardia TaxID=2637762 RepID=UPI0036D1EF48